MLAERIATVTVTSAAAPLYSGGNAFDLIALDDIKLELQLTTTTDDVWLSRQITRASNAIMQFVNRPIVPQTYEERFFFSNDPWPKLITDHVGVLQLSIWPLVGTNGSITINFEPESTTPINLIEGLDYRVDIARGQITRLDPLTLHARNWPSRPIIVQYRAGYSPIPDDIQDACIRLVKSRYFARDRDPMIRQENVSGVVETSYWFGNGPGSNSSNIPPDVAGLLSNYRAPVVS